MVNDELEKMWKEPAVEMRENFPGLPTEEK
jgi:hypothetical protein